MSTLDRRRFLAIAGSGAVVAAAASVPLIRHWTDEPWNEAELDLLAVDESTFGPHVGSTFHVDGGSAGELRLAGVENRGERQFSLLFEGAAANRVPERIHRLSHRRLGRFDLFLSPGPNRDGSVRYEAAFNHGGS